VAEGSDVAGRFDPTEQRLLGVLIEKQFTVPDSYPLSENALVTGANQQNNRDPVTNYQPFQVAGAMLSLQQKDAASRVEGGGRVTKYRHRLDELLRIGKDELCVFAELMLRGPQAPGALKPRVARMGYHATPEQIELVLQGLAARRPALVEQLPLGPRERDRRWRHLLGDGSGQTSAGESPVTLPSPVAVPRVDATAEASPPPASLAARVESLEASVRRLEATVRQLEERLGG
jgi:uncharacterized protein